MRLRQNKFMSELTGPIFCMLFLVLWLDPGAVAHLQAQISCETELTEAQQKYDNGRFDEAIEMVQRCLEQSGLSEATQLRAYRLMALAYQGKDYVSQAREAIRQLLKLVPNYMPDPVQDTPSYIELVNQVRAENMPVTTVPTAPITEKKKGGGKKWLFIGGGAVGAAVIAAVLLGGGNEGNGPEPPLDPLPIPPDLP